MRQKLQGWNFNPNASFGKNEAKLPLSFPMLPIGWAELSTTAQRFASGRCHGSNGSMHQCQHHVEPSSLGPRQCCNMHIVSLQHRC